MSGARLWTRTYVTRPSRSRGPPPAVHNHSGLSQTFQLEGASGSSFTISSPASATPLGASLPQHAANNAPILSQPANRPRTDLDSEALATLQQLRMQGHGLTALAERFGVTRSYVSRFGFPDTTAGRLARKAAQQVRVEASKAQRANWGWKKWCVWFFLLLEIRLLMTSLQGHLGSAPGQERTMVKVGRPELL